MLGLDASLKPETDVPCVETLKLIAEVEGSVITPEYFAPFTGEAARLVAVMIKASSAVRHIVFIC
jgi:hypothetical protein